MDRRKFAKLSAFAAAASTFPVGAQMTDANRKPIRFAPVGLGSISDIFMNAVGSSSKCKIAGLVTGHPQEKAGKYTGRFNIPQSSVYTYETFDRIKDNPEIDAVYIGLPNSMHAEYTVRAARAGKHVLCEKPMAISSAECREMIAACQKAKVKLMIAYRVHYDPTWTQMLEMVRSGAIGTIKSCDGAFPGIGHGWRADRTFAGGGSIMDLGIYPLNGIRYVLGEEPTGYSAMVATRDSSRVKGMEETMQWMMRFPSGILASGGSSYGERGPNYIKFIGDKGWLNMANSYSYDGLHLTGQLPSGAIDITSSGKAPFQFTLEADHFADCVHNNTVPKTPGEEGLRDLLAIEAIYKAAGTPIA